MEHPLTDAPGSAAVGDDTAAVDDPARRLRSAVDLALAGRYQLRSVTSAMEVLGVVDEHSIRQGREFLHLLEPTGLLFGTWPGQLGGLGLTEYEQDVIKDRLADYDLPDLHAFVVGTNIVGPVLCRYATSDQQERWLRPLRRGDEIWCQAFSEPEAGSDLASLRTRAVREGHGWRVNGQKVWSSRAHYADRGLLLARTDPQASKHSGITCFALPVRAEGVEVRPLKQMNGEAHFNEIFMEGVWIDDADRIGDVGQGWPIAMTALSHERGGRTDEVDIHQLKLLVSRSDPHRRGVVRHRIAHVIGEVMVGRWAEELASTYGPERGPFGSVGKIRRSRTTKAVAAATMLAIGGEGLLGEGDWQAQFLTSPAISIRGGTDEIQKNIIGERILGLPREPRPDSAGSPLHSEAAL